MITIDDLTKLIDDVEYHIFQPTMTVCCITLKNGFKVVGESACVDPKDFKSLVGQQIAYNNAFDKLWLLEGYRLKYEMAA